MHGVHGGQRSRGQGNKGMISLREDGNCVQLSTDGGPPSREHLSHFT